MIKSTSRTRRKPSATAMLPRQRPVIQVEAGKQRCTLCKMECPIAGL